LRHPTDQSQYRRSRPCLRSVNELAKGRKPTARAREPSSVHPGIANSPSWLPPLSLLRNSNALHVQGCAPRTAKRRLTRAHLLQKPAPQHRRAHSLPRVLFHVSQAAPVPPFQDTDTAVPNSSGNRLRISMTPDPNAPAAQASISARCLANFGSTSE